MIARPRTVVAIEGRSAKVIAVVVIGVLVAIVRPWGASRSGPASRSTATTASPASPIAASAAPAIANYDPEVFGLYEPTPNWELWPAGYLVSFGFATRVESGTADPAPAGRRPVRVAGHLTGAGRVRRLATRHRPRAATRRSAQPVWPSTIRFSSGSHLSLLGINTPLGYAVTEIDVSRERTERARYERGNHPGRPRRGQHISRSWPSTPVTVATRS